MSEDELDRISRLGKRLAAINKRLRDERRAKKGVNAGIKKTAAEVGWIDGIEYWIVPRTHMRSAAEELTQMAKTDPTLQYAAEVLRNHARGFNGYVVFPSNPTCQPEYGGLLKYVPVHGGITWQHEDDLGCVFGFDTAHITSGDRPIESKPWIKRQCEIMIVGIRKAAELELKYIGAKSDEERLAFAQQVFDVAKGEGLSFDAMLSLTFGEPPNRSGGEEDCGEVH